MAYLVRSEIIGKAAAAPFCLLPASQAPHAGHSDEAAAGLASTHTFAPTKGGDLSPQWSRLRMGWECRVSG